MEETNNVFGEFIRRRRTELKLKSKDVASALGFEASNYSMWEAGKRKPRRGAPQIAKLANLLGVSKSELLGKLGFVELEMIDPKKDILPLLKVVAESSCTSITMEEVEFLVHISRELTITKDLLPLLLQNRIQWRRSDGHTEI